jgi:hypothetical protein
MDSLTKPQQDAVEQLQALTNSSDPEVAIGILQSANWDVQVIIQS